MYFCGPGLAWSNTRKLGRLNRNREQYVIVLLDYLQNFCSAVVRVFIIEFSFFSVVIGCCPLHNYDMLFLFVFSDLHSYISCFRV